MLSNYVIKSFYFYDCMKSLFRGFSRIDTVVKKCDFKCYILLCVERQKVVLLELEIPEPKRTFGSKLYFREQSL